MKGKKITLSKRVLAVMLSVMMMFTIMPMSVFATETTENATVTQEKTEENPAVSEEPVVKEEAPAPEAPKEEAPAPEAPKEEAPAPEAPKEEAPVPEAPKEEAPAPEAPKEETPAPEAPKEEAPAPEVPKEEAPVISEEPIEDSLQEVEEEAATPKATTTISSLSAPLLLIDEAGGEPQTTTANRSKGYQAQFSVRATDSDGVPSVWLGYRFTLKTPAGYKKNDVRFDAQTHIWLRDNNDTNKVAVATYDNTTQTWTLEGKYFYNDPSRPLGSGAALTYSTAIAIRTDWVRDNVDITPTMETWLIDNPAINTGVGTGATTTVKNTPTLRSQLLGLQERTTGYYDTATRKFYYTEAEATAAGATNAIQGRVFAFFGGAVTEPAAANEKLVAGQEVTFEIPLKVKTSAGEVTEPNMQPILLMARYNTTSHVTENEYADGLNGDLTFGGRDPGTTDAGWNDANMPGKMKSVTFQNGVVKTVLTPDNEQTSVLYYMVAFVPGDKNDTETTQRKFVVGEKDTVYTTTPTPSGVNYGSLNFGVAKETLVKPMEGDKEAFNGAYSRAIEYEGGTNRPLNTQNTKAWFNVQNFSTNPIVEIKAFDMLVKIDADYMIVDGTQAHFQVGKNSVALSSYPIEYGVLPGGGNWASDAAMSSTKKDALTFYAPGAVPAGSKVVAVLAKARGGTKGGVGTTELNFQYNVTNNSNLIGTVGQMTLDVDVWGTGMDPDTDEPIKMHASDHGGYVKDYYDDQGIRHEDRASAQLLGDSFLVVGYKTVVKSDILNGVNRPTGANHDYSSSFDITAGARTMDIKDTVTFNYLGKPEDEPTDTPFTFRVGYAVNSGGIKIQPDSIQLNATYIPSANPAEAGIIQGGTMPDKVEVVGNNIYAYFTVTGSGPHEVYASASLGDPLNPDKDMSPGTKTYYAYIETQGPSAVMAPASINATHNPSIAKSTVAGFIKTPHSKVAVLNGEVGYRLSLTPQNRTLTGALTLDIFPFNKDGRGTKMTGSYTVDKPITMTMNTTNDPMLTDADIYYTTDTAIRTTPLKTVDDIKGITFTDGITQLGVTWIKAPKTLVDKTFTYTVDPNTTAIVLAGSIGSKESPAVDFYLQTKNMSPADALANDAGFTANDIGDSMISKGGTTSMANRSIEGVAWKDLNRNGAQDASETKLSGLTVKLFHGTTEITQDAVGNVYDVVTDANGNYKFDNIPSSTEKFHVEFSGGDIGKHITTEKTKAGVAEDKNSDVSPNPATGVMTSAISDEVNLLTIEQQNATNTPIDMKQLDAGFVPIYTITYDADGGAPTPPNEEKLHGDLITEPTPPTKTDVIFDGWYYTKPDGTEAKWDFATDVVTGDLDLVAKWADIQGVDVVVSGTKTLTGGGKTTADITAGLFKFDVARTDTNGNDMLGLIDEVSVEAGGALTFGTWTFSKPGTYTFSVTEQTPPAGYTAGSAVDVTVEVTLNVASKKLEATTTYSSGTTIEIANTYKAPDAIDLPEAPLQGTKFLHGKIIKTGQFSFSLTAEAGNPAGATINTDATTNTDENISFGDAAITFDKAGTYKFVVAETGVAPAGYTYDTKPVTVTVPVTLNTTTNTLEIGTVTYEKDGQTVPIMEFVNEYQTPDGAALTLRGTKTLTENGTNKAMTAGQFSFEITEDATNNVAGYENFTAGSVDVTADGNFKFDAIKFKEVGTYKFSIAETDKGAAGYHYDANAVDVTVKVTLNTATNLLETAVTYSKNGTEVPAITFANTYDTPVAINSTEDILTGTKVLNGNTIQTGQFEFALTAEAGNPAGATINNATTTNTDGDITFGDAAITFDKVGTYKFVVTETGVAPAGYTYDTKPVTITVPVTLNTTTNTLEVGTVTYEKDGQTVAGIEFINEYQTPDSAAVSFRGTKTLTENGTNKAMTAGQFSFEIAEDATNNPAGYENFTAGSVDVTAAGSFGFSEIKFKEVGTYKFIITETDKGAAGYHYDTKEVTATVTVTLNTTTNLLETKVAYSENGTEVPAITFANTYDTPVAIASTEDILTGTKVLNGNTIQTGQFSFSLTEGANNPAGSVINNAITTNTDGDITFGDAAITFDKVGTYKFVVTETGVAPAGYTYDTKPVTITVPVTLNTTTNMLEVGTVTYEKDGQVVAGIEFVNSYTTPDPSGVVFNGTKALTENGTDKAMTAGQFSFEIVEDATNNSAGYENFTAGSVDVTEAGTFRFDEIKFKEVGTYKFMITETDKGAAGYAYDTEAVTATVEVTLNATTNELEIATSYEKSGEEVVGIAFTNLYTTPDPQEVILEGMKELTVEGESKDITAGQFSFNIVADDTNDTAGYENFTAGSVDVTDAKTFTFDPISFTKVGIYKFMITETDGGAAGYTYDDKAITATVTVTLNTDTNELETAVSYEKDGNEVQAIEFVNTYENPAPVPVIIDGNKTLVGDKTTTDIKAEQFTFDLKEAELNDNTGYEAIGNTEAKTVAGGAFSFGEMNFNKEGTYEFTITEKDLGVAGYTYDTKEVLATVVVTLDTDANEFRTTLTYKVDGEEVEGMTFENSYAVNPVTVDPPVKKVVKGTPQKDSTFNFMMKAVRTTVDGLTPETMPMPENSTDGVKQASVVGAGEVEFGTFTYEKVGTYVYEISEVKGTEKEYAYDATVYTITDVVTDDNSNLVVERIITANGNNTDEAVFTNVYTAPAKPSNPTGPQTGDNSPIGLWFTALILSGIGLMGLRAYNRKKKKTGF